MKNRDDTQLSTVNSQLKNGYKQTEVGVIPEDWNAECMEKITIHIGDGLHGTPIYSSNGEYFFINGNNLSDGKIVVTGETRSVDYSGFVKHRKPLSNRSILLSINGTIGNLAFYDGEQIVLGKSAAYLNIRPEVFKDFVYHSLQTNVVKCQFFDGLTGSTIGNLGLATIRKTQIPLPPTNTEQRAIATALSDVDALLAAQDKLIAKKRDLKQAAMQQLLTGKQRLRKTGENGELMVDSAGNPVFFSGEWEVKRLGEIADIDSDNLSSDTPANYAFNYISLEDVDKGFMRAYSEQFFGSAPSRARRRLKTGDILVSTVRPNLQSHLLFVSRQRNWVCSTGFSVVRCKEQVAVSGYVFAHIFADGVTNQIEALLTGSNYPAINGGDVKRLEIPIPPIEEQLAIAAVLSDMDTELAALELQRDKTRALKQGMMQELLTGKIRLIPKADNHG